MKSKLAVVLHMIILLLVFPSIGLAGSAILHWKKNTDADLAGYRVYYGTQSRTYGQYIPVGKERNSYKVDGLQEGKTYYFALTAVDVSGNESGYSAEVSKKIMAQSSASQTAPSYSPSTTTSTYTSGGVTSAAPTQGSTEASTVSAVQTPVSVQITANDIDGVLITRPDKVVSLSLSIKQGSYGKRKADFWISAVAPFGNYSYVYGQGWEKGTKVSIQGPIGNVNQFVIYNGKLPAGRYDVSFAVDNNADGVRDNTWTDTVSIIVVEEESSNGQSPVMNERP